MLNTLVTRLSSAWQKREKPATRLAAFASLLLLLAVVAHTARYGTTEARAAALLLLALVLAALAIAIRQASRRWRNERRILRQVLFPVDRELGNKALRAYDVVEQTTLDASLGSPALAKHHYERLLRQASLEAVSKAAAKRAVRWRWFGYATLLVFFGAVIPDPMRLVEGFDVLCAIKGKAPLPLTYVDLKRVSVKPPSYLREPVRAAMPGVSGRFAAGSTIVVQGRPRYDGRELVLTDGTREVAFVDDGHDGITANWTLTESVNLRVAARHGDVRIEEPEMLPLEAIADQAPKVWVEQAPKTIALKDLQQLDIRYRAEDDHGIRQVDLVIASGKRETRRVLLKLDGEDRSARGGYSLNANDEALRRMFLPVQISVEAKDDDPISGPKWGRSLPIVVLPPTIGEPEAKRFTALAEARNRLVDVLALYAEAPSEDPIERRKQLDKRRVERANALEQLETTLEQSHAGLPVAQGLKSFMLGQLRVLKRAPRPGVSAERQLQDAVLAIDVALGRLATRDAQSVAVLLADVVEDVAEGAKQARETEDRSKGLTRLDHSLALARDGAEQLSLLGILGEDLGSVAVGDLDRVKRARERQDLTHTELAARHLAERLRRPSPSFGGGARGGVEAGAAGGGTPQGEPSKSDQQFDRLAQELEHLAHEHARGMLSVEQALEQAERAVDDSQLRAEAARRASEVRDSVASLPDVGADPGSSRADAALAREHARAMAQNLEGLDLKRAVESAERALEALRESQRKSEHSSLADWLDPDELRRAEDRLKEHQKWAKEELAKLRRAAEQQAREGLVRASEFERELAQRAGNLSGRGKNDQTPLPEDVLKRLDRAELLMRQAAQELAEGSAEKGLSLQRDAQRLLEQSRTGKTSDRAPGERSDSGSNDGEELDLGGEVPDPDKQDKAADFRERVLKGLGQEREGRLGPAVKRYAEGLLR